MLLYDLPTLRRSVGVSVATEIRLASGWKFVTLKVSLFPARQWEKCFLYRIFGCLMFGIGIVENLEGKT